MSQYKDKLKDKMAAPYSRASSFKGAAKDKVTGLIPGRAKREDGGPAAYVAAPLSSLRDPASFAPPPKRTTSGLAPPPPPPPPSLAAAERKVIAAPSKYQDPRAPNAGPPHALSIPAERRLMVEASEPDEESYRPPQPYRVNKTGLSTEHLPPPPARRGMLERRDTPDRTLPASGPPATTGSAPSLPPRLPPRSGSGSPERTNSPLSALGAGAAGSLNQGAISRLGAAGISVPAFGIGSPSPADASSSSPLPPSRPSNPTSQLIGLQNRFSRLGTSTSSTGMPTPSSEGSTWAQKQAALKTASSFHKDPSSVSLGDAKAAFGTANNFRQRHGDQVAAGVKSANSLNQKYGVADRTGATSASSLQTGAAPGLVGKKKPPPPPPNKKPGFLTGDSPPHPAATEGNAPPPIPLSTRPVF